ncbi:MAG: hypothetical protein ABSB79_13395 [Syntrophales bacterium]|jgi:hypothetical protein
MALPFLCISSRNHQYNPFVNGYIFFPHPKEKKFKTVPLLAKDIELFNGFKLSFPAIPFSVMDIIRNKTKILRANSSAIGFFMLGGKRDAAILAL